MTIAFSSAAAADIDGIWDYRHWEPDQADRYYTDDIRNACQAIASSRRRGRPTNDIRPGYLKLPSESHMIYYREQNDRLEIIRILPSYMDADRHIQP